MNTNKHENLLHKDLSYQIQGAAIEVRKNFGSGLKETIYQNAFAEELKTRNIKFEKEKSIQIFSPKTGKLIGSYRPDFIVEDKILIELKAEKKVPKMFLDQSFSYLRNSKYELGYFINFASPKLYIKRLIFTNDRKPFLQIFTKISCLLVFLFVLFSVLPLIGQAAQLNLTSETQEIGINQQFQVDLVLDTENEEINAVEGKISFPADLLELKEIRDGNSIINFWIERPKAETQRDTNINTNLQEIVFSGITPGGYTGEKGLIFSAIFQPKKEGQGTIEILNAKTLLNDGKGTQASLSVSNFQFLILKQIPISQVPISEIKDTDPPEDFRPEVVSDPAIFEGRWFLVFSTQDKGTGIDHYEILEKEQKNSIWGLVKKEEWQVGESPYLLKDQKLKRHIFVKAVDKAGNERIVTLPPKNPLRWYENYLIWIIIILGIIIFWFMRRFL